MRKENNQLSMGQKYHVSARLNGYCSISQESKDCKTFIGFLITIVKFRLKYPIVDADIRNGYSDCDQCCLEENKPLCYSSRKGE